MYLVLLSQCSLRENPKFCKIWDLKITHLEIIFKLYICLIFTILIWAWHSKIKTILFLPKISKTYIKNASFVNEAPEGATFWSSNPFFLQSLLIKFWRQRQIKILLAYCFTKGNSKCLKICMPRYTIYPTKIIKQLFENVGWFHVFPDKPI